MIDGYTSPFDFTRLDLRIPQVHDRVARVLAKKLRLKESATAPVWRRNSALDMWFLASHSRANDSTTECGFCSFEQGLREYDRVAAGISEAKEPSLALVIAWNSVYTKE